MSPQIQTEHWVLGRTNVTDKPHVHIVMMFQKKSVLKSNKAKQ